jgi:hypothetical protein
MKFDILSVREPVWANAQHTAIDCRLRTSAYSEELPFTASPNDVEEHGREIFGRCMIGEFGEIQPYITPRYTENHDTSVTLPEWTLAWPEVHDFLREANVENARNSPRAIALVWGTMLETMLNTFIECQLKKQGRQPNILKYNSGKKCGTTFQGRIDGALAEEMIDTELSDHLHAIRSIRNACAHEWHLSYDNPKIGDLVGDFALLNSAYLPIFLLDDFNSLIKIVFSSACSTIIIGLAERSVPDGTNSNSPPTE